MHTWSGFRCPPAVLILYPRLAPWPYGISVMSPHCRSSYCCCCWCGCFLKRKDIKWENLLLIPHITETLKRKWKKTFLVQVEYRDHEYEIRPPLGSFSFLPYMLHYKHLYIYLRILCVKEKNLHYLGLLFPRNQTGVILVKSWHFKSWITSLTNLSGKVQ